MGSPARAAASEVKDTAMVEDPPSCPTATLPRISGRTAAHADQPWPMSSGARSGSLARPASRRAVKAQREPDDDAAVAARHQVLPDGAV